jgi:hypothetical protein
MLFDGLMFELALSPKVEAALRFFVASKAGVDEVRDSLERQLDELYAEGPFPEDDEGDLNDIDGVVRPEHFLKDWKEGIDGYENKSRQDILKQLGIADGPWPHFNDSYDSVGQRNPSSHPSVFRPGEAPPEIKPLRLRWDQLVGVARAVDNAFKGHPLALCDEVGFGKTIQLAAVIAILRWFRATFSRYGKFPGAYGELTGPKLACLKLTPSDFKPYRSKTMAKFPRRQHPRRPLSCCRTHAAARPIR